MDLTLFRELGLSDKFLVVAATVFIVLQVLGALHKFGFFGFASSGVRTWWQSRQEQVEHKQKLEEFEVNNKRQDELGIIYENTHLTGLQIEQNSHLVNHILEVNVKWHEKHDKNYANLASEISKTSNLTTIVEEVYEGFKQQSSELLHENEKLKLELEQAREYITALETKRELKD